MADVEVLSSRLVAALELTWDAIRARHSELPAVVVVLAAGSIGAAPGTLRLGHYAAMRWHRRSGAIDDDQGDHGDRPRGGGGGQLAEVFVGGEGLRRGPVDVLGTLLHEAGHALADVRRVKDTSRQGRYHNRRYAEIAREVGLHVAETGSIGWSDTRPAQATREDYADVLDSLTAALTLWRRAEGELPAGPAGPDGGDQGPDGTGDDGQAGSGGRGRRPTSNNPLPCTCACPRRIRVAPKVLELGPITCGLCAVDFVPADAA